MHYNDDITAGAREIGICDYCEHYGGIQGLGKYGRVNACEAFPDGIPDKFWREGVDHTTPYPGDNGITFSPKR